MNTCSSLPSWILVLGTNTPRLVLEKVYGLVENVTQIQQRHAASPPYPDSVALFYQHMASSLFLPPT